MDVFKGIDFKTKEGFELRELMKARLSELREHMENPMLSNDETAVIRGRIAELKMWVADRPPLQVVPRYDNMTPRGGNQ